jgi:hypothetical protein
MAKAIKTSSTTSAAEPAADASVSELAVCSYCGMSAKPLPPAPALDPSAHPSAAPFNEAIAWISQIADEGHRAAAVEAAILLRVRAERGFNDPAGELAMRLRRAAQ